MQVVNLSCEQFPIQIAFFVPIAYPLKLEFKSKVSTDELVGTGTLVRNCD